MSQYTAPFVDPPVSAADRRPGDRPYYIENACVRCGGPLVYAHLWCWTMDEDAEGKIIQRPVTPADPVWFDEFICPIHTGHFDLHYLDWPQAEREALAARAQEPTHSLAHWRYLKRIGRMTDDHQRGRRVPPRKRRR